MHRGRQPPEIRRLAREVVDGLPPRLEHGVPEPIKQLFLDEWKDAYNRDWEGYLRPGHKVDNL